MNIAYLYEYVTKKTGPATSIRGLCGPDEFEVQAVFHGAATRALNIR